MKIEPFCFAVDTNDILMSMEDATLQAKGVIAFASADSSVNAFSSVGVSGINDSLKNFCSGVSVNSTSKVTDFDYSKCVLVKNGSTTIVSGGVTDMSTAGEVSWSFPNYNASYYVFGFIIGE